MLEKSVYGLPEANRDKIKDAQLVACPGCYPTSITLPLHPLLKEGLLETSGIVVSSVTGVTGAGRKVALNFIFPECNENAKPYGAVGHRHLPELEQELAKSAGLEEIKVNFIPHLIPVSRGIHSTIVADFKQGVKAEDIQACWEKYFGDEPFVRVLGKGTLAETKHVTLTNICEIGFAFDERTGKVILSSAIDNLTKGSSGQAVQCMNIMFGLDESAGL